MTIKKWKKKWSTLKQNSTDLSTKSVSNVYWCKTTTKRLYVRTFTGLKITNTTVTWYKIHDLTLLTFRYIKSEKFLLKLVCKKLKKH